MGGPSQLAAEFGLPFPVFQPIDAPWVNNTGQEQNAGDEELICSARKRHFVRHGGGQPSRGQRKNRSRPNNAVEALIQNSRPRGQCRCIFTNAAAHTLFYRRWAQHHFCLAWVAQAPSTAFLARARSVNKAASKL